MEPIIKPTIGRVMWFKDSSISDQFCTAHVVYVHEDAGTVNLAVSTSGGYLTQRIDIPVFQGPSEECPELQACWMPYQKAQAAK